MLSTVWAFHSRLNNLPDSIRMALIGGLGLAVLAMVLVMILWRSHGLSTACCPPERRTCLSSSAAARCIACAATSARPLGLTIFSWLMEGSRLYFVLASLHLLGANELGISAAIFLALGSSVLTTLPITAGGLGVVEGFLTGSWLRSSNGRGAKRRRRRGPARSPDLLCQPGGDRLDRSTCSARRHARCRRRCARGRTAMASPANRH